MSNPFAGVRWIWMNGKLVEFEKATVHVMTHALHYGSGVFEGIRCYNTRRGSAVFRLPEHVRRLEESAKVYRMDMPFAGRGVRRRDPRDHPGQRARVLLHPAAGLPRLRHLGVNPLRSPVDAMIACWPWGKYLGDTAEQGVDVCVSSWRRPASQALPAVAKATGNYLNSQLIKMEAITNGYAEGIALDSDGYVSEGSGENIFMVRDGVLTTPPPAASLLPASPATR